MFDYKGSCTCILIWAVALILGIIVGVFSFTTAIPGIITALWIAFGTGTFAVALVALLAIATKIRKCLCRNGRCLIISAIGTIITTIIALSITITTASVLISILIAVATFFLASTIFNILKLLLCLVDVNCGCGEY